MQSVTQAEQLLEQLSVQGIKIGVKNDNLSIRASKGAITSAVKAELIANKADLLTLLRSRQDSSANSMQPLSEQGLSLYTIGRVIGGFGDRISSTYKPPVINPRAMAEQLTVTFRPLPKDYKNQAVIRFREALREKLEFYGAKVLPWEHATRDFKYEFCIPGTPFKFQLKTQLVKSGTDAVLDVERPSTVRRTAETSVAEMLYGVYCKFFLKGKQASVMQIAKLISWAEDHAAKFVEDPTNTQVIALTPLDTEFTDPNLPYQRKISLGLNRLIDTFSELVIGISEKKMSILNMNLSDSVFERSEVDTFVAKSLIPKIFVPILPLPMSRFELGTYEPTESDYARNLVTMGKALAQTGLYPPGFKLDNVIERQSYRDIINVIVNGRTGVSYGFVAYAEPPQYVGDAEIDQTAWNTLAPIQDFNPEEIRQNHHGRRYLRLKIGDRLRYKQIPDVWLTSSRSGANKTNLDLKTDVLRIGLTNRLVLQTPVGVDIEGMDIKPSYDLYVMVSIALGAALYTPELIQNGSPIIHFHGYTQANWFRESEAWEGVQNPSVPCGTYESGVFNFLSLSRLANRQERGEIGSLKLATLVEPDHGTNILASDLDYLLERVQAGCAAHQIELGGKHFPSLKTSSSEVAFPGNAISLSTHSKQKVVHEGSQKPGLNLTGVAGDQGSPIA